MNPTDDIYGAWVAWLHRQHRPALEAHRARAQAAREAQNLAPGVLESECARLREEIARTAERIRQAAAAALDRAAAGRAGARADAVREALAEFPRLFPPGAELPAPARAAQLLGTPGADGPDARRERVRAALARVAELVSADGAVVAEVTALRAEEARLRAAANAARDALSARHLVPDTVLDAIKGLQGDGDFRELCERIAADAAIEAGWGIPDDVLAPVRRAGGAV